MRQSTLADCLTETAAATIGAYGTTVTLADGSTLMAEIIHADHELIRGVSEEGASPGKRPLFLLFRAEAWGRVTEGTRLSMGGPVTVTTKGVPATIDMTRWYRVSKQLHPRWVQGRVVELAVGANPD